MGKIIFLGTTDFAVSVLATLRKSEHEILRVFTQPPNKSKRGQKIIKTPIHQYSEKYNLPVNVPNKLASEINLIKSMNLDLAVVVAYGQIIPKNILNLSKYGFLNIHASLLPKYRGASPIQRSIINLDKTTGVSFMRINEKLDTGPVCSKYEIKILNNEKYKSLSQRLSNLSSEKIIENIDLIINNKIKFINQNHKEATYAKKIDKKEGKINWYQSAECIQAKINGLSPSPGAWFNYNNERYKIQNANVVSFNGIPGKVLNEKLVVACGKKSIEIIEIQKQGKKSQNSKEFLLGNKIEKGSNLNDE